MAGRNGKAPEPKSDNERRDFTHFACYLVLSNHRTDLLSTVENNHQAQLLLAPPPLNSPWTYSRQTPLS